jgi:hypothetical protein
MGQQWTCPYCNRPCTIDHEDIRSMENSTHISYEYGAYFSKVTVIVCPNPKCRQRTISAALYECTPNLQSVGERIFYWKLLPESEAKPFPEYIPKQLRDDYAEACLIKDKSPKASATLSRRCLQGIIRDFWEIKKNRLVDEIEELKSKVDSTSWEAINSVRHLGNIGAHMEKDVNLIIGVDPDEAGLLIWLIELFFEEWYIARHDREEKMIAIKKIADDKKAAQIALSKVSDEPKKE